ncbi:MAG TPA: efflux transporter outer membrane subunit [Steroidobacteraceae bacterium]|nr:efflux transporter outer membrane subunit [Steroidobacteraceae bacterium]
MHRAYLVALVMALAGCALGPNFKRPAAPTAIDYGSSAKAVGATARPETVSDAQRYIAGMDVPDQWWRVFGSQEINGLVARALAGNPNIKAAQAALRQAHELYLAQRTSFFPNVQGSFAADRSEFPVNTLTSPTVASSSTYTLYTAQLSLSYAPDIFGATRRQVEIAQAQAESARFQLEASYVTLSTNVVVAAIQEASLRGQIATTERLLQMEHQLTGLAQQQRRLGTASDLDVLSQLALEAQTAQMLPPLQKQLGQTRDALIALLGKLPSDDLPENVQLNQLTLPADLPLSVPSKLVEQRPDVRQAEENLHAATAAVGVAITDLLPQFAITADVGSSALTLGKLFTPYTGFWDAGASLTQTLLDAGALIHKKHAADAALDQAAALYRAAVILACQNVADTLRAIEADADAQKASGEALRAAEKTFDLAQKQRALGTINLVALLNAEQSYGTAALSDIQARANRYADTAALFQALGGGWWNRTQETR